MKDLKLIKSEKFNDLECDFYKDENEDIFVTRYQIGKALQYSNPSRAISDIHNRHKERLDKFSRCTQIALPSGGVQEVYVYNAKGIYEICRYSNQAKADMFYDFVYDVLEEIRKTGGYNSTNKLFAKLTECQIETSYNLVGLKRQLDETSNIISEHDKLLKERVYISPKEAKDVQKAIYERAKIIAIDNNLPYHEVKKALFKRLYITVNDTFEVATYRELPSYKFMDILDYISKTNVYTADLQCECGQISL